MLLAAVLVIWALYPPAPLPSCWFQVFDLDHLARHYSVVTLAQTRQAGWSSKVGAMVTFKKKDYREVCRCIKQPLSCMLLSLLQVNLYAVACPLAAPGRNICATAEARMVGACLLHVHGRAETANRDAVHSRLLTVHVCACR